MKKRLITTFLIIVCVPILTISQNRKNYATNVSKKVEESRMVVTYDIPNFNGNKTYAIDFQLKNSNIKPEILNGSGIGDNISAGNNLEITWNFSAEDYSRAEVAPLRVKVFAVDLSEEIIHTNAIRVGTGMGIVGLFLITSGLIQYSNNSSSNDDYKIYEINQDPNDPIWIGRGYSSRSDLYDTINRKYVNGQILAYTGTGILIIGTFIVKKIIKKNKENADQANGFKSDRFSFSPVYLGNSFMIEPHSPNPNMGIGISIKF